MKKMRNLLLVVILFGINWLMPEVVWATSGEVLGVHILSPDELPQAKELLDVHTLDERWHYVTIPLTLADLEKQKEWQVFFHRARELKVKPVVRLVTRFENGAWQVPNRKDIVSQLEFLSSLEWPTSEKPIIVFNEVNHSKEWGGQIDPLAYAEVLKFTSQWARSEGANFVILPAAMDLAAPNGPQTMEAFNYLNQLVAIDPEIFSYVDIWNSHSYPNPGFSASPYQTAQNSVRGFEHELAFLKKHTGKDYQVFISETGWENNKATRRWLEQYYTYAIQHVWSHPQVIGVTPFVLRGDPGPFSGFAFLDRNNEPTAQYLALQRALEKLEKKL